MFITENVSMFPLQGSPKMDSKLKMKYKKSFPKLLGGKMGLTSGTVIRGFFKDDVRRGCQVF